MDGAEQHHYLKVKAALLFLSLVWRSLHRTEPSVVEKAMRALVCVSISVVESSSGRDEE